MIVESACGSVFGACLSEPWPECDAGRGVFYGTGETFLFTLSPYAKMYPWVGRVDRDGDGVGEGESDSPSMFIMATRHEITLGGGGSGFGLWLNEDLSIGTTDYCQTFANSPLTGNGEKKFECLSVEVYAFE
ncbi:hypothetical protein HDU82_007879 [Entophlyctis luteolus]|nr:hypothetical protein HDU82_007879 [Entophlyctis luteolus]